MLALGFKPTISTGECPKTCTLDCAAIDTGSADGGGGGGDNNEQQQSHSLSFLHSLLLVHIFSISVLFFSSACL
jgi:hypothetical protein